MRKVIKHDLHGTRTQRTQELMQKGYGMGSGISLFIATNICESRTARHRKHEEHFWLKHCGHRSSGWRKLKLYSMSEVTRGKNAAMPTSPLRLPPAAQASSGRPERLGAFELVNLKISH